MNAPNDLNRFHSHAHLSSDAAFAALLIDSFERIVGRPLAVGVPPTADGLYRDAPFCVLAHDGGSDPTFIYANESAQACFGYDWAEFTRIPSRLSAEAPERDERQRLLDAVARQGFIDSYRGIRIAKSGRRFWIEDAVVWELVDRDGVRHGQAATFDRWRDV